jgi:hypothetical protein
VFPNRSWTLATARQKLADATRKAWPSGGGIDPPPCGSSEFDERMPRDARCPLRFRCPGQPGGRAEAPGRSAYSLALGPPHFKADLGPEPYSLAEL